VGATFASMEVLEMFLFAEMQMVEKEPLQVEINDQFPL